MLQRVFTILNLNYSSLKVYENQKISVPSKKTPNLSSSSPNHMSRFLILDSKNSNKPPRIILEPSAFPSNPLASERSHHYNEQTVVAQKPTKYN